MGNKQNHHHYHLSKDINTSYSSSEEFKIKPPQYRSQFSVLEPGDEIMIKERIEFNKQSFEMKKIPNRNPKIIFKSGNSGNTNRLMFIPKFLSIEECTNVIEKYGNYETLQNEYSSSPIRNASSELVIEDREFADMIYNRLKKMIDLNQIGKIEENPYGLGKKYCWIACGINKQMKICKYKSGENFKIHRDEQFRRSENEKSIYSLVMYLNEDFKGGETRFYKDPTRLDSGNDEYYLLYILKPFIGSLALFSHDLHYEQCSFPKKKGTKYIFKSEIIYMRIDAHSVPRDEIFETSRDYQKIKHLFLACEKFEKSGDGNAALECYCQAQRMLLANGKTFEYHFNRRFFVLKGPIENSSQNALSILPDEIAFYIFSFLTEVDLCFRVLPLNRYINFIGRSPLIWKNVYKKHWDDTTFSKLCKRDESIDWYLNARFRNFIEHQFQPRVMTNVFKNKNNRLW